MKKHFVISCIGFLGLGIFASIQMFGAYMTNVPIWVKIVFMTVGISIYVYAAVNSIPEVIRALSDYEDILKDEEKDEPESDTSIN